MDSTQSGNAVLRVCTQCNRFVANRQKTMCGACVMGFCPDDPPKDYYARQLDPASMKYNQVKYLFLSRWYSQGERRSAKVEYIIGVFPPHAFVKYSEYQAGIMASRDYVNERRLFLLSDFQCPSLLGSLTAGTGAAIECNTEDCRLCALVRNGTFIQPSKSINFSYEPPHCADYSTGPVGTIDRRICVVCKVVVGRSAWTNVPTDAMDGTQDGDSLLIETPGHNSQLKVWDPHAAVPIYVVVYSNDVSLEGPSNRAELVEAQRNLEGDD